MNCEHRWRFAYVWVAERDKYGSRYVHKMRFYCEKCLTLEDKTVSSEETPRYKQE